MKVIITGAGLSGAVSAVLMKRAGHSVEVYESRRHIAGNCYDERVGDVTVHKYGTHIFHTDNTQVWKFLSRYTEWNDYRHKVVAQTSRGIIPIPWSKATSEIVGDDLSDEEIRELIFREYSEKQWGIPFSELPQSIRGRLPVRRDNYDTCYFTDRYQGQPAEGYSAMFSRMLDGIPVHLGVAENVSMQVADRADLHIYTGKIDAFFNNCLGRLPYRSLRFEHEFSRLRQPYAIINQCNNLPWTRIYDHSWFLNENPELTVLTREFPVPHDDGNEPFYPMPFGHGAQLYSRYRELARSIPSTIFVGRLATYSYLDMWMAVAQVIVTLKNYLSEVDASDLLKSSKEKEIMD